MSLATREQKAVVTDFCACRALWFFHAMKERIKQVENKELPINNTENFTARYIIHRMLHQCNKRNIIY